MLLCRRYRFGHQPRRIPRAVERLCGVRSLHIATVLVTAREKPRKQQSPAPPKYK